MGLALLNLAKGLHPHLEKNSKISFFGNKSIVAIIVTRKIQLVLHAFWGTPVWTEVSDLDKLRAGKKEIVGIHGVRTS